MTRDLASLEVAVLMIDGLMSLTTFSAERAVLDGRRAALPKGR